MSVTFTLLDFGSTGTDATTIVTNSFDQTSGSPFIVCVGTTVGTQPANTPTYADTASNSYTGIKSRGYNGGAVPLKKCSSAVVIPNGTGSIVLTVSFAGQTQTGRWYAIVQCNGADVSGTIVQSDAGFNDSTAANFDGILSLSAFGDATNNGCLAMISHSANETTTAGAGMTSLFEGHISPSPGFIVETQTGENLAPTASWSTTVVSGGWCCEIKASSGAATNWGQMLAGTLNRIVQG